MTHGRSGTTKGEQDPRRGIWEHSFPRDLEHWEILDTSRPTIGPDTPLSAAGGQVEENELLMNHGEHAMEALVGGLGAHTAVASAAAAAAQPVMRRAR